MLSVISISVKSVPRTTLAIFALSSSAFTPTMAQQVPAVSGLSVTNSAREVPVVEIATPNTQGISHNIYSRFDVQEAGVILNNSAYAGTSAIGGYTLPNRNVQTRQASLIINEVRGAASN